MYIAQEEKADHAPESLALGVLSNKMMSIESHSPSRGLEFG